MIAGKTKASSCFVRRNISIHFLDHFCRSPGLFRKIDVCSPRKDLINP